MKITYISVSSVSLSFLYWLSYICCYIQSKKLDLIYSDMGSEYTSKFTKNINFYTSIGMLTPALFIFVILALYLYNSADEMTIKYDIYGFIVFISIVGIYIVTIIGIIIMIPSLFESSPSGLMSI